MAVHTCVVVVVVVDEAIDCGASILGIMKIRIYHALQLPHLKMDIAEQTSPVTKKQAPPYIKEKGRVPGHSRKPLQYRE